MVIPGTVELCQGPVNYRIKLQDGKIVRRHITQIRKRSVEIQEAPEAPDLDLPQLPSTDTPNPNVDTPDPEPTSEQDQSRTETQPLQGLLVFGIHLNVMVNKYLSAKVGGV